MGSLVVPDLPTGTDRPGSLISHEMADNERRVGDVQNEPAQDASPHVFLVENPGLALLAEIAREGVPVILACGEVQANGKQSRYHVVDFDGQRFRVDEKFKVHGGHRKKRHRPAKTERAVPKEMHRPGQMTGAMRDRCGQYSSSGALVCAGFSSFGASATVASVVRISPAIDAAFWSAVRATLVGSTTPASTRSPYSPVAAL